MSEIGAPALPDVCGIRGAWPKAMCRSPGSHPDDPHWRRRVPGALGTRAAGETGNPLRSQPRRLRPVSCLLTRFGRYSRGSAGDHVAPPSLTASRATRRGHHVLHGSIDVRRGDNRPWRSLCRMSTNGQTSQTSKRNGRTLVAVGSLDRGTGLFRPAGEAAIEQTPTGTAGAVAACRTKCGKRVGISSNPAERGYLPYTAPSTCSSTKTTTALSLSSRSASNFAARRCGWSRVSRRLLPGVCCARIGNQAAE